MATKTRPGEFDCYGQAEPDEPLFTLRAKDPLAPVLVRLWAELQAMTHPVDEIADEAQKAREKRKQAEATDCAEQMESWYEDHLQQMNEETSAAPSAAVPPAGAERTSRAEERSPRSR